MDFLKIIIDYFISKEYSFGSKFFGIILIILALLFIDNLLGFTFYYSKSQKISQLKDIVEIRKECSDEYLIDIINETEQEIITRKDVIESFFNLFSKEEFDQQKQKKHIYHDTVYIIKYDTITIVKKPTNFSWNQFQHDSSFYEPLYQDKENLDTAVKSPFINKTIKLEKDNNTIVVESSRSRIWHTISSSYILIVFLIVIPFLPFTKKPIDWNMFIGAIFAFLLCAGLIWLNQFLLGLIPVILNRPWINYMLNFIIHLFMVAFLIGLLGAQPKNT